MTQRGLADVEQRLGERMGHGFSTLTALMQDMLTELTVTHTDVRSMHGTVDTQGRSDTAPAVAIKDLTTRVQRLERNAGLA